MQWQRGARPLFSYFKKHKGLVVTCLTALICVYVGLTTLPNLLHEPMGFDGAIDLQASVNMADNGHYASFGSLYNGQDTVFDPGISTGPSVLVPIAVAFKLFGVGVIQARIVMLLFYFSTLCILSWYIYSRSRSWLSVLAPLSFLLIISSGIKFRIDILGELPAVGFAIGSIMAWEKRRLKIAGVLASLAILCKFLMAFLLIAGFICLIADYLFIKEDRKKTIKDAAHWTVGSFGVLGLWELVRFMQTGGPRAYIHNLQGYIHFIKYNGSGIGGSHSLAVSDKFQMMIKNISMSHWTMLAMLPILGYLILRKKFRWKESFRGRFYPLSFIILYLTWWLFISNGGYTRYTVPVVMIAITFIFAEALEPAQKMRDWRRTLCLTGLSLLLAVPLVQNYYPYHKPLFALDLQRQQAIAQEVVTKKQGQLVHYGFWQNPEIQLLANMHSVEIGSLPNGQTYSLLISPTMRDIVPKDYEKAQKLFCKKVIFSDSGYVYCTGVKDI